MARERRFAVWIDGALCKGTEGCGLCLHLCGEQVLGAAPQMNPRGVHPAVVVDARRCNGCGLCVLHCPDLAVWLEGLAQ